MKRVVLGDQHVGVAVAVEVDEAQIRVAPVDVRAARRRPERLQPSASVRS